jgi:gluconokinase
MVIALDIGTSSARAALYDEHGRAVAGRFHRVPYEPLITPDGGVEHDAGRLLDAAARCLDAVVGGPHAPLIAGVGVTTFWHGLLGFDASGRPVTPVYTWADSRATGDAALLRDALDENALRARTGCHFHACYWPAKLRWLARARPDEVRRVARWGSIGEHLELSLFGRAATSLSMASGTGLFDQAEADWSAEALAAAGVDPGQLFPLCDRREARHGLRARWARRWPRLTSAEWFPAVGDGAASNVGSDCTDASRMALNVGTSAALRVVTDLEGMPPRGLWRYRIDRQRQLVGGATSEGGNVFSWCREILKLPDDAGLETALAARAADGHGLTVLPFLAGERSPGWRGDRRALVAGLSLDTTAEDIVHAALEAVALRLALVYQRLAPCAAPDHVIVASGGGLAHSAAWTRMIADALGRPLARSVESEATSRGAALLALEATGVLRDLASARAPLGETIDPDPARHARYRDALARQRRLDDRV